MRTYAGDVDYGVDIFHGLIKTPRVRKVIDNNKIKSPDILWSCLHHEISLFQGPGGASDIEAPAKELVDNMRSNKPRGSGDEYVLSVHCQLFISIFVFFLKKQSCLHHEQFGSYIHCWRHGTDSRCLPRAVAE